MDRDKIIEGAKRNKARGAEFENAVELDGSLWATLVTDVLALLMIAVKWYGKGIIDFGALTISVNITGIQLLVKGIRLRKWWQIIFGVACIIFTIICLICFLGEVFL